MERIDTLPWYDNYMLILENKTEAEKGIEDLENPEKQLQRVKKFYQNLGADYTKNELLVEVEANISLSNSGEDSRLNQLKREVKIAKIIDNAIRIQDDESIAALNQYKDDETYRMLVKQIMFYIGVSKVKSEPAFIKRAYDAIYKTYPLSQTVRFNEEGVHYFIYYFQCLKACIQSFKSSSTYEDVRNAIKDRCYNARLMFKGYSSDIYVGNDVEMIVSEITDIENMLSYE